MIVACPQCRAPAPRGVVAGKAYACPRCGNPVLAVERKDPAPAAVVEPEAPPRRVSRWKVALLAFVVLGAAYFAAYELLTAEAKRERDQLLASYGPAIESFPPPLEAASPEDPAAFKEYVARKQRWEDRRAYEAHTKRVDVLFGAMLLAFALQTAFTAWVAIRSFRRAAAARPP